MINDVMEAVVPPFNPIKAGKIIGAYGILGWIRIISFTEKNSNIFYYQPWFIYLNFKWSLIHLVQWKIHGEHYIAKIINITNRDSAELLKSCSIIIDIKNLPSLNDYEYYWNDIIGCVVVTVKGDYLGCVINIIETGSNDVLVVTDDRDHDTIVTVKKDYLIPFLNDRVVKSINMINRTIVVDWDRNF